jgi:hypothetical protein
MVSIDARTLDNERKRGTRNVISVITVIFRIHWLGRL